MIVDFIELPSGDKDDDIREAHAVHGQVHSFQVKGDFVDLTTEGTVEAQRDVHGHGDAPQNTISQNQGFQVNDGQGEVARCNREFVADNEQGGAARSATTPHTLESIADDRQGCSDHHTTKPQRPGSTADAQSDAAYCITTPQRPESVSNGQGDIAHCTETPLRPTVPPFPRQFWKAGEYRLAAPNGVDGCQNRLRIHPKFLPSNATSHKWVFDAIAELLDNAVDEIHKGATFVKIDKIKHAPDGEYSLMIQGGMSPESLRRCMSFGFSNKCSTSIGEYGNGFKTSTMRLGADVIVFTCKQDRDNKTLTQSVGLLSYTFLMRTRCNDILVPVVDYEFDTSSSTFKRIMNCEEKHFLSNLSVLLKWSPFSTEEELLNQFRDMNFNGRKIIVFNLWFKDECEMELDFITDEEDIIISDAKQAAHGTELKQMHVANRLRYSLHVYSSILYLHLPKNFRIILCGRVVDPHHLVNDLIYRECIKYQPQVKEIAEVDVYTTIGFLKGAPKLDIYGFNVYHKNRLIMPFWPSGSFKHQRRGIAGVLEANFMRPTHDKQDFEKTELFHRLETRLRDMATEYWRYHCHLVGYVPIAKSVAPSYYVSTAVENNYYNLASQATTNIDAHHLGARIYVPLHPCSNGDNLQGTLHLGALTDQMDRDACPSTSTNAGTTSNLPRNTSQQSQTEVCKRRNSLSVIYGRAQKRQKSDAHQPGSDDIVEVLRTRGSSAAIDIEG